MKLINGICKIFKNSVLKVLNFRNLNKCLVPRNYKIQLKIQVMNKHYIIYRNLYKFLKQLIYFSMNFFN